MNEPIQRVYRQEDSNSTLGTIATHVGINLATSAATEGAAIAMAKTRPDAKVPLFGGTFHNMAYRKGNYITSGMATKKGRIMNYTSSVGLGLLTGALTSPVDK